MNKYSIIAVIAIVLVALINLFQPFQKANACNSWDPDYNYATGECDLESGPSGLTERPGKECGIPYYDYNCECWTIKPTGTYATDCKFAVVGYCTPEKCPLF